MAASGKDSLFSSGDIKFVLTFAAGMAGFWLSGHLPGLIPVQLYPHNYFAVYVIGLLLALLIYGLGMVLWSWFMTGRRALKPAFLSGVVVMILALITSLILTKTSLGHVVTQGQLAVLAFVLYLVYGLYYVIGWGIASRFVPARKA